WTWGQGIREQKKLRRTTGLLVLVWCCAVASLHAEPAGLFERCWQTARDHICPASLAVRFTPEAHDALALQAGTDAADVAAAPNPSLDPLNVSHTQLYTRNDLEYWLFRSMFTTGRIETPVVAHLGAQFVHSQGAWHVRSVFDGSPAERAGLRRGDVILNPDF